MKVLCTGGKYSTRKLLYTVRLSFLRNTNTNYIPRSLHFKEFWHSVTIFKVGSQISRSSRWIGSQRPWSSQAWFLQMKVSTTHLNSVLNVSSQFLNGLGSLVILRFVQVSGRLQEISHKTLSAEPDSDRWIEIREWQHSDKYTQSLQ